MEIDKKLYEDIKAFCDINGLKPRTYIHELLKKGFIEDKYGASPFEKRSIKVNSTILKADEPDGNGRVYPKGVIEDTIDKFKKENVTGEIVHQMRSGDAEFSDFIENVGGSDAYNDMVSDLIFDENVTNNGNTDTPEPIRDIMSQEVSRKDENLDKNLDNVSKSEPKKPKKRQINVK